MTNDEAKITYPRATLPTVQCKPPISPTVQQEQYVRFDRTIVTLDAAQTLSGLLSRFSQLY